MPKNNLIALVSTLSSTEVRSLNRAIKAKTKTSSQIWRLYTFIINNRHKWPLEWESSKIREKLFGEIQQKTFLNMMSTLYRWCEEWLLTQNIESNELEKHLQLIEIFKERGLFHLCNLHISRAQKIIESLDDTDLRKSYYGRELYHSIHVSANSELVSGTEQNPRLDMVVKNHLETVASYSSFYLIGLIHGEKHHRRDYSELIEKLARVASSVTLSEEHHLSLALKIVGKNDLASFNLLKEKVLGGTFQSGSEIHRQMALLVIQYSGKLWTMNKLKDKETIAALYEHGLSTGVLLDRGKVPERLFHNIVAMIGAIRGGEWNRNFIAKWWCRVDCADPDANKKLAIAQDYFCKGKYELIVETLRGLKFKVSEQRGRMLGLELIAWFEERDRNQEMFELAANRLRRYLNKHQNILTRQDHESHLNLLKILMKINQGKKIEDIESLYSSNRRLIHRYYVGQKIEAMRKRNIST